ncbi:MAG: DUF421 domain-containing protein [Clostridia bacterium]|nr:DUF421 domain-containing protein [Clostridia bacterium]
MTEVRQLAPLAFGMVWKAAFFYVLLLVLLRFMGKREIASYAPLDLVVSIMLADAAIISIEDDRIPVLVGILPVLVLVAAQILLSWLNLKSPFVRDVVEGVPTIVIRHGIVDETALRRQRMNLTELLSNLRLQNIQNLEDVEWGILEPSGRLSVMPVTASRPVQPRDLQLTPPAEARPMYLVLDGAVDHRALAEIGRDDGWLAAQLRRAGVPSPRSAFLAVLDPARGTLAVQPRQRRGQPMRPVTVQTDARMSQPDR